MLLRTYIHRYVHTKVLRLLRFNPIKGRSLMAHIRRTRHIMMPSHRSCFFHVSYAALLFFHFYTVQHITFAVFCLRKRVLAETAFEK